MFDAAQLPMAIPAFGARFAMMGVLLGALGLAVLITDPEHQSDAGSRA